MLTKYVAIVSLSMLWATGSVKAVVWSQADCTKLCTQEKCQKSVGIHDNCQANCKNFADILAKCNATTGQATKSASKPAGRINRPLPTLPTQNPAPTDKTPNATPASTRAIEAEFLEKISDRLLLMTNRNCNTLLDEVYKHTLPGILPKPAGYEKKFTAGSDAYQSAKDFDLIFKQINQSFKDLKTRVADMITQAKNPQDTHTTLEIFEKIYGDIDLNSRKNCEKYTTNIKDIIKKQNERVNEYNKSSKSLTNKIKQKF